MSEREKTVQGLLNAAVEDETLRGWRLMGEAADTIERLVRERDEARRELEELDFLRYEGGEESIGREIEKAEARGYRRGVEDAAKALGKALENPIEQRCCGFGLGSPPECCATPISLIEGEKAHAAILALLEQTGDTNSPNPENGAVPKSET